MDLKFKKILLIAMKFNNANQLKIKATPNKIVNLQLFSSVGNYFIHKYRIINRYIIYTNT